MAELWWAARKREKITNFLAVLIKVRRQEVAGGTWHEVWAWYMDTTQSEEAFARNIEGVETFPTQE
jgi:hypothetical protein